MAMAIDKHRVSRAVAVQYNNKIGFFWKAFLSSSFVPCTWRVRVRVRVRVIGQCAQYGCANAGQLGAATSRDRYPYY